MFIFSLDDSCEDFPEKPSFVNEVYCETGYKLPSGRSRSKLYCSGGKWILDSENYKSIFDDDVQCLPNCDTPCKNGGMCSAPNKCSCPLEWEGEYCEKTSCNGSTFLPKGKGVVINGYCIFV